MIIPYITFHGTCAQALEFYTEAFKAEKPRILYYGDYVPEGMAIPPSGLSSWVMHAELDLCGSRFWFADEAENVHTGNNVKLVIVTASKEEAERLFKAVSSGGTVDMPPTETFYSVFHASLTDKFGICWDIVAEKPEHRGN